MMLLRIMLMTIMRFLMVDITDEDVHDNYDDNHDNYDDNHDNYDDNHDNDDHESRLISHCPLSLYITSCLLLLSRFA